MKTNGSNLLSSEAPKFAQSVEKQSIIHQTASVEKSQMSLSSFFHPLSIALPSLSFTTYIPLLQTSIKACQNYCIIDDGLFHVWFCKKNIQAKPNGREHHSGLIKHAGAYGSFKAS